MIKVDAVHKVLGMIAVVIITIMLSMLSFFVPTQTVLAHTAPRTATPFSPYRFDFPSATIQIKDAKTKNIWNTAIKKWNGTHAFTFRIVRSNAQITADSFSSMSKTYSAIAGITYSKYSGSQLLSAHVRLNLAPLTKYRYTTTQKTNVAEHELGHSMGLLHNPSSDSLMYYKNRKYSVQPVDVTAVKKDYKFVESSDTISAAPILQRVFHDPASKEKATIQSDELNAFVNNHVDLTRIDPSSRS